jgi:hypothetical protein
MASLRPNILLYNSCKETFQQPGVQGAILLRKRTEYIYIYIYIYIIFSDNKTVSARQSHNAGKQSKSDVCKYKEGNSSFANKDKTQSLVLKWL